MQVKLCSLCKQTKEIIYFSKNKARYDGLDNFCKKCKLKYAIKNDYDRKKYSKHKEKILQRKAKYYRKNKVKIRIYENLKFKNNINYRLAKNIRSRIRSALKNNQKIGSAIKDLGCSIEEFKKYLELKFQPRMSWENYGFYGWHIDHIIPLSKFDLTNKEQFLKACHYTNLQPLWKNDNISKGDRT